MSKIMSFILIALLLFLALQVSAQGLPAPAPTPQPASDLDKILSFAQWLVTIALAWLIPSPAQQKLLVQSLKDSQKATDVSPTQ